MAHFSWLAWARTLPTLFQYNRHEMNYRYGIMSIYFWKGRSLGIHQHSIYNLQVKIFKHLEFNTLIKIYWHTHCQLSCDKENCFVKLIGKEIKLPSYCICSHRLKYAICSFRYMYILLTKTNMWLIMCHYLANCIWIWCIQAVITTMQNRRFSERDEPIETWRRKMFSYIMFIVGHWFGNYLSTTWCESIIRTNTVLLSTVPPETNFSEIVIGMKKIISRKFIWKCCVKYGDHCVHVKWIS